ncbi:MAG: hypothetical protein LBF15_03980 [Candidatus Peribacteria bacterium]|jgi:hypothetical protein|nr:hypothetical protein [Candidatus Peribacteria bacterium]
MPPLEGIAISSVADGTEIPDETKILEAEAEASIAKKLYRRAINCIMDKPDYYVESIEGLIKAVSILYDTHGVSYFLESLPKDISHSIEELIERVRRTKGDVRGEVLAFVTLNIACPNYVGSIIMGGDNFSPTESLKVFMDDKIISEKNKK